MLPQGACVSVKFTKLIAWKHGCLMPGSQIGFAHLALLARLPPGRSPGDTAQSFDETPLLRKPHARETSVGPSMSATHARHADDLEQYVANEVHGAEARALGADPSRTVRFLSAGYLTPQAALRTALEPLARPSGADDERPQNRRLAPTPWSSRDARPRHRRGASAGQPVCSSAGRNVVGDTPCFGKVRPRPNSNSQCRFRPAWSSAWPVMRRALRVLLDADSAVIDVGRARRVVPASTRRALNVRDRCCQWPGASAPASWSGRAHHLVHWCRGGRTDLSNPRAFLSPSSLDGPRGWVATCPDHSSRILTIPPPAYLYRTQLPVRTRSTRSLTSPSSPSQNLGSHKQTAAFAQPVWIVVTSVGSLGSSSAYILKRPGDKRWRHSGVRGSVRAWLPATAVAVALAVGLGAAAYFSLVRGSAGSAPAPSPSVDIHSKEAVMAAVRHYYQVEDKAGETGDMHLIVAVTTGPGTPAYENLKEYFREQAAKNRNSIITKDDFRDWQVAIDTDRAAATRTGSAGRS